MKRFVAIILLSCLLLTLFGYHLVFRLHLSGIRAEMKQRLCSSPSKDVVVLVFNKNELSQLEWENGHEFRYQDEMYDVVDQRREGNRVVIRCLHDKKEKVLLEAYQKIAQKHNGSPLESSLVKFMETQFIIATSELLSPPQKEVKTEFYYYSIQVPANAGRTLKHPPRVC